MQGYKDYYSNGTLLTEPSSSYLGQLAKVSLADVSGDAIIRVLHVLAHKGEGVGRC